MSGMRQRCLRSQRFMPLVAVGGRVPENHALRLKQIQAETGKSESELIREAVALLLGKTSPDSCVSTNRRLSKVEQQLARLQRMLLAEVTEG